ncbi:MAG: LeuA family protein [Anaerolineae bacterium]
MSELRLEELIYDWNNMASQRVCYPERIMITDETLRDGLQSPSITQPDIEDKVSLVYLMNDLGVACADLGLPGAGPRFRDEVAIMAKEIANNNLNIQPQAAGRTLVADIEPIVDASLEAGIPIEAALFIGSSPVRQYVEGWTVDQLCHLVEKSVGFAVKNGLPVMFVTEDTTRAKPEDLKVLYKTAIEAGAHRICLADTVGHAIPHGVHALTKFIKEMLAEMDVEVGIDWHGHRDRGLDIANSLAALGGGADRVHACALGVGERSGNTPMELLLVNLRLLGLIDNDLSRLTDYTELVSESTQTPMPYNKPVVGPDAFRTSTGVHAAAIAKALKGQDDWLGNIVYSGVPADMIGRRQRIEVGPMSGLHNVRFWLEARGLSVSEQCMEEILTAAKRSSKVLSDEEIMAVIKGAQAQAA